MKVELREVRESDLPVFLEHQLDPIAHRMAGFTPRAEEAFMAHWRDNILGDPSVTGRTVLVDGQPVGYVVCFDRDGKREVGYWIGRAHWGKGIASRALRSFLPLEPARPVHAIVSAGNAASMRVLEKCGFNVVADETDDEKVTMVLGATSARGSARL